ncbi:SAM-dependent methyltransferase [Actinomadura atramentaria]|uniref:SAM-dependent methyltransferase n=1 Tax=Actinomadura atramentaria TaxID=1990 RepID=UPI000399FB79|nr:SAM-dependent methyltransferase [Actinomadura atramentaria]
MELRLLGERLDVRVNGTAARVDDPRVRRLLCALALCDGSALSGAELGRLFGADAPAVVAAARAVLEPAVLSGADGGCRLDADGAYVDVREFRARARWARALAHRPVEGSPAGPGGAAAVVSAYRRALALWTGRPPGDVPAPAGDLLLAELRRVREEIAGVLLAAGRPCAVIDDARHWLDRDPGHERMRTLLETALDRAAGSARSRPGGGPALDARRPSPARIYDHFLGGKDNYAVDRAAAAEIRAAVPAAPGAALANRAFVGRAVRYAAGAGVRQFLDVGAGLPTRANVHEIARAALPGARVVYVDRDPVVLSHGRALLEDSAHVAVVEGDLRDPAGLLRTPRLRELIDVREPVGVLLCAVLHFLPDEDDPYGLVEKLTAEFPSGSHLIVTHGADDADGAAAALAVYRRAGVPLRPRACAEVARFFAGFDVLDPGVVRAAAWRPDPGDPADAPGLLWGAVGRRP